MGWAYTAALLTTALDDLLGAVNDDRFYSTLDHLGEHKDALCSHLMQLLPPVVRSASNRNPQAQRGYSPTWSYACPKAPERSAM